jgi:hypothetical protein
MYGNPVLLPQVTNREDLLRTVSLFDDLTGQPIDFSGRTLQFPGDYTFASWKVVDGIINTTSTSLITIKDYPFGNEMQAISFVVGLNLGILPGDPITISDSLTGLNTLTGYVTSYAPATGAIVVQIGAAFDFEMRAHHGHHGDGYSSFYGAVGDGGGDGPIIRAQLGSGITVIGTGVIQILIPAAQMFQIHRARTYNVALGMYLGPDTRQIFLGKQPVLYGGLSTQPIPPAQPANIYGLP